MRKLIKIASFVVVGLIALVVAVVAVLSSLDFNQYKGLIEQQAKAATGRDLTIKGELDLQISLTPALVAEDVTFANATWGSRPEMATLKRLEAEVALLPLLSEQVDVRYLVFEGLDLLLETRPDGSGNWAFGRENAEPSSTPPSGSGSATALPVVRDIRLRDSRITYLDERRGLEQRVVIDELDLAADGPDAPLDIALNASVNDSLVEAEGALGTINQLASGKDLEVDLKLSALKVELTAKGKIADVNRREGVDLVLEVKGGSFADVAAEATKLLPALGGFKVPDLGEFDVAARISGGLSNPSLTDVRLALSKSDRIDLKLEGRFTKPLEAKGLDLTFEVEIPELASLGKEVGAEFPALPALSASGRAQDAGTGYNLSDLALTLGNSDLAGNLTADINGARPKLSGQVSSKLVDVDELLAATTSAETGSPAPSETAPVTSEPSDGRVFPDDPLPLEALKLADADLRIQVEEVRMKDLPMKGVDLGIKLANGNLDLAPLVAEVDGAALKGNLTLDASGATARLAQDITLSGFDYGRFLAAQGTTDQIEGKADIRVAVQGKGSSIRALMAGLNGETRIASENGKVESGALDFLAADVLSILPGFKSADQRNLRCVVAHFDIQDGIANARSLVVETVGLSLVGLGDINLKTEALNLGFEPRAKNANLLKLASVPFGVGGTLASPKPTVDTAATAGQLAGTAARGVAAFTTLGLSLLAEKAYTMARKTVDKTDYCGPALAGKRVTPSKVEASGAGTNDAPDEGSSSKPEEDKLNGIGEAIEGGIKNLFGQ